MAVYSKLLLSAGGGIIYAKQAKQKKNTATVLIGLGGTGIDCLRVIKTQVYRDLEPDDPGASVPQYSHIQFLGVDTDESIIKRQNTETEYNMSLDDKEFFFINADIKNSLGDETRIKQHHAPDRFCLEEIKASDFDNTETGGIEQSGGIMMRDKSEIFLNRIKKAIDDACRGLSQPVINLHIFSGISKGTGGGSFLDVCYMVRSITENMKNVAVFGYFFLPDVNLGRIDDKSTGFHILENGYAAMEELNYCMHPESGVEDFVRKYQGHEKSDWKKAPVDMCHFIGASDMEGNIIPHAYEHAMKVTAQYIMEFLRDSGMESLPYVMKFKKKVEETKQNKTIEFSGAYCAIGASGAYIPFREINTYLVSELFNEFSGLEENVPTGMDVENLVMGVFRAKSKAGIYDFLLREIRQGAEDDYIPYVHDWKYVRDCGNDELIHSYIAQTEKKSNRLESNAKEMMAEGNGKSLWGRFSITLKDIICDIEKGPIFAYSILSSAQGYNFLNIIDELIEENKEYLNREVSWNTVRYRDYENAEKDFNNRKKRSLFDNSSKRFDDYEFYLCCLERHKLYCNVYEKLDEVLKKFRERIIDIADNYYIKLSRVTSGLINIFKENSLYFAGERDIKISETFSEQIVSVEELKPLLDKELKGINIPVVMREFMELLLDNEEAWITEDENKITKLVTGFFAKWVCKEFSDKTVTSFLADKYNTKNDNALINIIYEAWIKKLTAKASPLFAGNKIWNEVYSEKRMYLYIPTFSALIRAAAERMYNTENLLQIRESEFRDRIYAVSSTVCLLCSYKHGGEDNI